MSAEQVEAVAKGRVWSGEEARERGLVDALGGYDVALRLAKEAAAIPADGAFELAVFPRPKSTIERIVNRIAGATMASRRRRPRSRSSRPGLPR